MAPSVILGSSQSIVLPDKSESQTNKRTAGKKPLSTPLPNPSLQVTADHNLKQEDAPVYEPGCGEVLLHIKATGVCGYASDAIRHHSRH